MFGLTAAAVIPDVQKARPMAGPFALRVVMKCSQALADQRVERAKRGASSTLS